MKEEMRFVVLQKMQDAVLSASPVGAKVLRLPNKHIIIMNKFTILFLTLFLALPMAMKADSAKRRKNDTRYLVGAVPEVDGKVVFSKEFQIPGNEVRHKSTTQ